MCHSNCICADWKKTHCGGDFSGDPQKCKLSGNLLQSPTSVLDVAVEASGAVTRTGRSSEELMKDRRGNISIHEGEGLDAALEDKCSG